MEQALRGCRRLYSVSQVRGRDVRFAQVGPTNGPTRISSSGDAGAACPRCCVCLVAIARLRSCDPRAALLLIVRLSSERMRQAVREDWSFARKQASPPALLVVVPWE